MTKTPNNEVQQSSYLNAHLRKVIGSKLPFKVIYDDGSVIVNITTILPLSYVKQTMDDAMASYKHYTRVGDGAQEGTYWLNVNNAEGKQIYSDEL